MKKVLSFDAETNGLWGQAFSIGAVLLDETRGEISRFVGRCPISGEVNDFVAANVLPEMEAIPENYPDYRSMLTAFMRYYMDNKADADIIVHMGTPVESRLFLDARNMDIIGDWDAPYPLIDIAAFPEVGDSVDTYNSDHGIDVPDFDGGTHNPLYDSMAAALCYCDVMMWRMATKRRLNSDFQYYEYCKSAVVKLLKSGKPVYDYDLEYADLSNTDLSCVRLDGYNLAHANFSGSNLFRATFDGSDLRGANFSGCNLDGATFREVDITFVNFSGADLCNSIFVGSRGGCTNFSSANLSFSRIDSVDFSHSDFSSADLRSATIVGANLRECVFRNADFPFSLSGANLSGSDFTGCDLSHTSIPASFEAYGIKTGIEYARKMAYFLCSLQCDDPEYIEFRNGILDFANQFCSNGADKPPVLEIN